jgi:murein L,D-transpeptidase YcbB/YkuD
MFSAVATLPLGWASAQQSGVAPQTAAPAAQAPAAGPQAAPPVAGQAAPPAAQPAPPPPPPWVAPPPPLWSARDAQELLGFIQQIGSEGLDPADYDPAGLTRAMRANNPAALAQAATDRFNRVSSDIALGHVRGKDRGEWYIRDKDLDPQRQRAVLDGALAQQNITAALLGLLPTHPQYRDLKNALATTAADNSAQRNRIKLNMDRWRWLPRDLGEKYIIVNVPAFYVSLVENGATRWRQRAVAGSTRTPTPMMSATATGVILNPWWEVPKSIEPEVRGKKGYVPVKGKDGKVQRWRQPPGPANALGELKFVMPNQWAIFLHDTNARSRFNSNVRSLSHGCIRTQNILDLAGTLLSDDAGEWTKEKVDEALASKKATQANFVKPLPVYIVYFSAAASTDGRIVNYNDVYRRDGAVLAALNNTGVKTQQVASK